MFGRNKLNLGYRPRSISQENDHLMSLYPQSESRKPGVEYLPERKESGQCIPRKPTQQVNELIKEFSYVCSSSNSEEYFHLHPYVETPLCWIFIRNGESHISVDAARVYFHNDGISRFVRLHRFPVCLQ